MKKRNYRRWRDYFLGFSLSVASLTVAIAPGSSVNANGYPADLAWEAITYGNGVFVAVASSGDGTRVMTSSDGATWTLRQSASDSNWQSVTFDNGVFVAVGTNAAMTSSDGITWTSVTVPDGAWDSVVGCNGTFAAAASSGPNFVMSSNTPTSSWTLRTPAHGWDHQQLACKPDGSRFVSSSHLGRVWSSSNAVTWSAVSTPIVHIHANAYGVINGVGTFVWLEYKDYDSNGTESATSTTGGAFTGQVRNLSIRNEWTFMTFGGSAFVVTAEGGSNHRAAYSTDGINWTLGTGLPNNSWQGVAYGNNKYVAVANSGTGDRIAISQDGASWTTVSLNTTLIDSPPNDEPPNDPSSEVAPPTETPEANGVTESKAEVPNTASINAGASTQKNSVKKLPQTGSAYSMLWFASALVAAGLLMVFGRRRRSL